VDGLFTPSSALASRAVMMTCAPAASACAVAAPMPRLAPVTSAIGRPAASFLRFQLAARAS
jgi:hypothetical protein